MTEPIYRLRSSGQYVKFIIAAIFTALLMVSFIIDPHTVGIIGPLMTCAGILLMAYVFFLMPNLQLDRDGLHLHNWFVDRAITWKDYQEIDSRFGMQIVSTNASDPVTSYPGSGGLTRGREQMSASLPLAKSEAKPTTITIYESGQHNITARMRDASSLISRMSRKFGPDAPDRPRTRMINPMRISLAIIGFALIVIGIQTIAS